MDMYGNAAEATAAADMRGWGAPEAADWAAAEDRCAACRRPGGGNPFMLLEAAAAAFAESEAADEPANVKPEEQSASIAAETGFELCF